MTNITLPTNYSKLSPKDRRTVREKYVELQGDLCYHCKKPLSEEPRHMFRYKVQHSLFPENFFKYPVHLHHNHNTGLTIGAVHCYCNAVLWQYFGE